MARIIEFCSEGDRTVLEYDPATADMQEVQHVIDQFEQQFAGAAFDIETGERVDEITREQNEVVLLRPIVGG